MDHKFADAIDRLTPLFQHGCEHVPCVDHVRPDLELDLHPLATRALGHAKAVIQQGFCGSNLDQKRWKASHLGMNR